jgi:hypothetical protein
MIQNLMYASIRYLISVALTSVAQFSPLDPKASRPFVYPAILAEFVVPQIEAYLAASEQTRFLVLKYEASLLPVVIELRRLFGDDVFKISGIIDGTGDPHTQTPPPSHFRNKGAIMLNSRRNGGHRFTSSVGSTMLSSRNISELFAKANFVISSTSTDTEISDFLSSIRDALLAKNSFYEPEPEPIVIASPPPIPQDPTSPRVGSRSRSRTPTGRRDKYDRSNYSNFSRPGTGTSQGTIRSDAWHSRRDFNARDVWEGFVDSDDDEYDRKLMPTVPRRLNRRGNSRKALKWLGLA